MLVCVVATSCKNKASNEQTEKRIQQYLSMKRVVLLLQKTGILFSLYCIKRTKHTGKLNFITYESD